MRTTIDTGDLIQRDLRRLRQSEGKTFGRWELELVAQSPAARGTGSAASMPFEWACKPMGIHDLDSLNPTCLDVLDPPAR